MIATAVVTGANRGIGLELCRGLKRQGARVVAACRQASDALRELGLKVVEGVDLTEPDGIQALVDALEDISSLDCLINNAGILRRDGLDRMDFEAVQRQFAVNALGPLRVTMALRSRLGEGSKVIMITSRMGSIADNTSGGYYGYRMSKAALNMASVCLAHDLRPKGVAVGIIHPGYVRTDMTGHQGHVDPGDSARQILERIEELTLETSGVFWHANGQRLPW